MTPEWYVALHTVEKFWEGGQGMVTSSGFFMARAGIEAMKERAIAEAEQRVDNVSYFGRPGVLARFDKLDPSARARQTAAFGFEHGERAGLRKGRFQGVVVGALSVFFTILFFWWIS